MGNKPSVRNIQTEEYERVYQQAQSYLMEWCWETFGLLDNESNKSREMILAVLIEHDVIISLEGCTFLCSAATLMWDGTFYRGERNSLRECWVEEGKIKVSLCHLLVYKGLLSQLNRLNPRYRVYINVENRYYRLKVEKVY